MKTNEDFDQKYGLLNLHISRFFGIFVCKKGRVNGLTNKAFNDIKREDYGDIYVLLHVVIRHLPCHLHGNRFHLEGDSEDADIPGPWNTALTKKAITRLVQWLIR